MPNTYRGMFLEDKLEIVEKILPEGSVLGVFRAQHGAEKTCNFFRFGRQIHYLTCG